MAIPPGAASRPGPVIEGADPSLVDAVRRVPGPSGVEPPSVSPGEAEGAAEFLAYCQQRIGDPARSAATRGAPTPHPLAFLVDRSGHLLTGDESGAERPRVCVLRNRHSGSAMGSLLLADAALHDAERRAEHELLYGLDIGGVPVEAASAGAWQAQGWTGKLELENAAATFGWVYAPG